MDTLTTTITTINEASRKSFFNQAYNNSYYTITGCGGDLSDWVKGYNELMTENGIGEVEQFYTFKGKDMNMHYGLIGSNAYPEDLTFLAFPLGNLHTGKLAIFRLQMADRWFDDIVDNNNRRQEEIFCI